MPAVLPCLSTERLELRALRPDDAAAVYGLRSDAANLRFWSAPPYEDVAQARDFIRGVQQPAEDATSLQWGFTLRGAAEVIGTVALVRIDRSNGRAEVGFLLGRPHQGRGLAAEAVSAVLAHAFDSMGLRRVEADIDPDNTPSLRLVERLGFQREGLLRERWCVAGQVTDTVFLGLLRREWARRNHEA